MVDPQAGLRTLGCNASAVVPHAGRLVAACGASGIWVVTIGPDGALTVLERRKSAGVLRRLFVLEDQVWVESTYTEARPLAELSSEPGPAPAAPATVPPGAPPAAPLVPPAATEPAYGRVLVAGDREIVVSLGARQNLHMGDHVEVYTQPVLDADELVPTQRERRILIGRVVGLSADHARVAIGLSESAQVGQLARVTYSRVTASWFAPPRPSGVIGIEAALRPFLPIETLSFGLLGELAVTYRSASSWYAQARLSPLGGLWGSGRDVAVFGAQLSAGYDHQYFSLGIGAGVLRRGSIVEDNFNGFALRAEEEFAFALTQAARLGALDGLHVAITNTFALRDDHWDFGSLEGRAQIPLGNRTWIMVNGGGGAQAGYAFTEVGLRRLVRGNGGANSVFVKPSVGVGGIDPRNDYYDFKLGPLIGMHLEWRK